LIIHTLEFEIKKKKKKKKQRSLSTHFENVEHFLRNHVSQIDVPAVPAVIAPVQHMVPVVPLAHVNMNIAVRNEDAMIGVGGGARINRQARQAVLHLQRDDIDPMSFPDGVADATNKHAKLILIVHVMSETLI
jgi:hypothetical protein